MVALTRRGLFGLLAGAAIAPVAMAHAANPAGERWILIGTIDCDAGEARLSSGERLVERGWMPRGLRPAFCVAGEPQTWTFECWSSDLRVTRQIPLSRYCPAPAAPEFSWVDRPTSVPPVPVSTTGTVGRGRVAVTAPASTPIRTKGAVAAAPSSVPPTACVPCTQHGGTRCARIWAIAPENFAGMLG